MTHGLVSVIDIVSQYNSVRHELVMLALEDAMESCRPDWSQDFRCWIRDLIQLIFDLAVLKNGNQWCEVVECRQVGSIQSTVKAFPCSIFSKP